MVNGPGMRCCIFSPRAQTSKRGWARSTGIVEVPVMHNMGGRVTDMEGLVASVYLVWSALLVLYWLWCMHGCVDLATAI